MIRTFEFEADAFKIADKAKLKYISTLESHISDLQVQLTGKDKLHLIQVQLKVVVFYPLFVLYCFLIIIFISFYLGI